jgi:hypothetical protein
MVVLACHLQSMEQQLLVQAVEALVVITPGLAELVVVVQAEVQAQMELLEQLTQALVAVALNTVLTPQEMVGLDL